MPIAKAALRRKNSARDIRITHLKLLYRPIIVHTVLCWHQNRPVDQQNRPEGTETNSHSCSHWIFNKDFNNIYELGKKSFSTNCTGKTEYVYMEE